MPETNIPINPKKIGFSAKSFTSSSMPFPYSSDFSFSKNLTVSNKQPLFILTDIKKQKEID